jgi:hypothetical protein
MSAQGHSFLNFHFRLFIARQPPNEVWVGFNTRLLFDLVYHGACHCDPYGNFDNSKEEGNNRAALNRHNGPDGSNGNIKDTGNENNQPCV